jgi:hypothetical protein
VNCHTSAVHGLSRKMILIIILDGSVKSPISALCCILRHCGVG